MTKAKTTQTTGIGLLSAAAILSAADLPHEDVAVPEWGGTVRIRTMTSGARDEYEQKMLAAKGQPQRNVRAQLVALCAVDEAGGLPISRNWKKTDPAAGPALRFSAGAGSRPHGAGTVRQSGCT